MAAVFLPHVRGDRERIERVAAAHTLRCQRINEDDLVRAEIAAALKQKIPVIPVVVQNASMPVADDLPDDMRLLARRNGIQLRPEQWREGVERLLKELDKVMGPASG